jgi:phage baseplate assembly protein W
MANNKYFGIKYPFTINNDEGLFFDTNTTQDEEIKSQLLHLLFTPVGQRIRRPDFGTSLMSFIFDQNDELSWSNILEEIQKKVALYVPKANLTKLEVLKQVGDEHGVFVRMEYEVKRGVTNIIKKILIKV